MPLTFSSLICEVGPANSALQVVLCMRRQKVSEAPRVVPDTCDACSEAGSLRSSLCIEQEVCSLPRGGERLHSGNNLDFSPKVIQDGAVQGGGQRVQSKTPK